MRRALVVVLVLLAGGAVTPAGRTQAPAQSPPVHAARAFRAGAEAFPVESAPGTRDTEVTVRQLATVVVASNPPSDAFARASTADLGLAEAYFGQQGPSADADTATADADTDDVVEQGGNHLEAHADESPRATATAAGNVAGDQATGSGTGESASHADASGARLVATAEAEVHDLALGLLTIGSGRFDARVETDGTAGGATASGLIRTSDATFADIPVTIGADGLGVDESRVPDALLGPTTAALQQAFSSGGYTDIRVVQPRVEVAEDGSSARVSGGGVFVFLTNNDPAERYFFSSTLLGGSAEVTFGGVLGVPAAAADPPPVEADLPASGSPLGGSPATGTARPPARPADPAVTTPPAAVSLTYDEGASRTTLRAPWPGWVWAVVLVVLAWAVAGAFQLPFAAAAKARVLRLSDSFADRYLRG